MAIASKKIEKLLKDSRVVIKNIQALPEIKEKIDRYGFDEKRIKEGDDLLSKAEAMYNRQMTTRGEQIDMTGKLKEGIKEILKNYMVFRRMTRRQTRGIENEGLRKTLGIDGEARRTLTGVLKEAQQFYEGISTHEEIGKKLEKFSLTKEKLGSYLAELDELKRLNEAQEKKKGEAQQSRKERDDLYVELSVWLSQFKVACKSALANDPQQLEKLGIMAFSENYRRKKGEKPEPPAAEKKETVSQV